MAFFIDKAGRLAKERQVFFVVRIRASAKDGEGAGRGPCGLRNSELGPRPHDVFIRD